MLPQPSDQFSWVQERPGAALVCLPFQVYARHFFTTRRWRLGSGGAEADRLDAWADVEEVVGVPTGRFVRVHQVHGSAVVIHRLGDQFPGAPLPDADVIVSNDPESALAVQSADCVPILVVDTRTGVCGAAHAGWRGLGARVPHVVVDTLVRVWGSRPADLIVAIGPAVGPCCYEVGGDVRDRFRASGFSDGEQARWFLDERRQDPRNPPMPGLPPRARPGRWYFDAWLSAGDQLTACGVPADRIHVAGLCTASHPGAFCSYRRDGRAAGRMAAVVCPPDRHTLPA
jgi:YfiH family protein